MKKLISLRNENQVCKSDKYAFTNISDNSRIVSYTKTFKDTTIEIILNCSKEKLSYISDTNNILFSNLYKNGIIEPDGCLVILKN